MDSYNYTASAAGTQSDADLRVRLAIIAQLTSALYWKDFLTRADHDQLDAWRNETATINRELAARNRQEEQAA